MTAKDIARAHEIDVRVQDQYGMNYRHYWVHEHEGKVFRLVDAPDQATASRVHREARGPEPHSLERSSWA